MELKELIKKNPITTIFIIVVILVVGYFLYFNKNTKIYRAGGTIGGGGSHSFGTRGTIYSGPVNLITGSCTERFKRCIDGGWSSSICADQNSKAGCA